MCLPEQFVCCRKPMVFQPPSSSSVVVQERSHQARVEAALKKAFTSGSLTLAAAGLTQVPPQLLQLDSTTLEGISWWERNTIEKVDLSGNGIRELPPDLPGQIPDCRAFNASDNQLESLPTTLLHLEKLKILLAVRNAITTFPTSDCQSSLVELRLSHNNLCELPRGFADSLPSLQVLAIDHNKLRSLDEPLPSQLRVLLASSNEIVSAHGVDGLRCLEEVDLSRNNLTRMPCLRDCSHLGSVGGGYNKLEHWPEVGGKVHTLRLSYNLLRSASETLLLPPSLVTLLLDNNKVDAVPGAMFALDKLKTLDLSNNDISRIPNELGRLALLTRVALDGNPVRNVPMAVLRRGSAGILKLLRERLGPDDDGNDRGAMLLDIRNAVHGSKHLDLSDRGLGPEVPSEVEQAEALELLDMSRNRIARLRELKSRETLLRLVMAQNVLKSIETLKYPALQDLDISNNNLTQLPCEVSLPQLLSFDASCNRDLTGVPKGLLKGSVKLQEIRANNCRIASWDFLPDLDRPHDKLEVLDLSDNRITMIPDNLVPGRLPGLHVLLLSNNNITALPPSLGRASALNSLTLEGNPIRSISQAVIRGGSAAILSCLRKRYPPVDENGRMDVSAAQRDDDGRGVVEAEIRDLEARLAAGGHTQAVEYSLKKRLAVGRAKLKRFSRTAVQEEAHVAMT
ncbi:Leucine-rich repeat-containing protein 40 [Perkinsus olseni]|uniref:Leucine-rich repeat-containing protein 40 n=3 Tax=Perkinsus olseni TaxID=32597 RepID=A0A7J6T3W3_PEROL|nr:Leucine-rich repeat-containing protein 40 [Perkinsus olseni]